MTECELLCTFVFGRSDIETVGVGDKHRFLCLSFNNSSVIDMLSPIASATRGACRTQPTSVWASLLSCICV